MRETGELFRFNNTAVDTWVRLDCAQRSHSRRHDYKQTSCKITLDIVGPSSPALIEPVHANPHTLREYLLSRQTVYVSREGLLTRLDFAPSAANFTCGFTAQLTQTRKSMQRGETTSTNAFNLLMSQLCKLVKSLRSLNVVCTSLAQYRTASLIVRSHSNTLWTKNWLPPWQHPVNESLSANETGRDAGRVQPQPPGEWLRQAWHKYRYSFWTKNGVAVRCWSPGSR